MEKLWKMIFLKEWSPWFEQFHDLIVNISENSIADCDHFCMSIHVRNLVNFDLQMTKIGPVFQLIKQVVITLGITMH